MKLTKLCNKCGFEKPVKEFNKKSSSKDGYASLCKSHTREVVNKWYQTNIHSERKRLRRRQKERLLEKREYVLNSKVGRPCQDCGQLYPHYCMDYDHRPHEVKSFNISDTLNRGFVSLTRLRNEINKCDLVCANCHRKRTFTRISR